jgi:uncharacterized protein (TIGR00369 family)
VSVPDRLEAIRNAASTGYWAHMGVQVLEAEDGRAVCRLELCDEHLNYNGIAHGGTVSGLVDCAAGLAVRTLRSIEEIAERPHATVDMHIAYLAGARAGGALVATGRIIKRGRTAFFAEVDVVDGEGRAIARGTVTFVVGSRRE